NDDMKAAMRSGDKPKLSCVRQLKSKVQEEMNAPTFKGPADDDFYRTVIKSYVKQLQKGMSDLEAGGDRSLTLRTQYQSEIDYLSGFLPQLMDEAATRQLIEEKLSENGVTEAKHMGRVMGLVMKD